MQQSQIHNSYCEVKPFFMDSHPPNLRTDLGPAGHPQLIHNAAGLTTDGLTLPSHPDPLQPYSHQYYNLLYGTDFSLHRPIPYQSSMTILNMMRADNAMMVSHVRRLLVVYCLVVICC